jgi:hypothetical protein
MSDSESPALLAGTLASAGVTAAAGAPRRPRKRQVACDSAVRGRFLGALAEGMPAVCAARAAGCAIATFKKRRGADAGFAAAWEAAVAVGAGAVPARFLDAIARGVPAVRAAAAAGGAVSTFFKRRRVDPAFAAAWAAAARTGAWAERAPGPPTRCDAAAQRRFLNGVASGLALPLAAEGAGCALYTFYRRRARSAAFAEAWRQAAEGAVLLSRGAARARGERRAKPRRLRFDAARRARFFAVVAATCNGSEAARAAMIDLSAVYKRLKREADLRAAFRAALATGYVRLEALAAEERRAEAEALRRGAKTRVPVGCPPRDFETQMRLLRQWRRPAPPASGRWSKRAMGRRFPARSHWENVALMERRLDGLLVPLADGRPAWEAPPAPSLPSDPAAEGRSAGDRVRRSR